MLHDPKITARGSSNGAALSGRPVIASIGGIITGRKDSKRALHPRTETPLRRLRSIVDGRILVNLIRRIFPPMYITVVITILITFVKVFA
jgi:hypothetical protein